MAQRKVQSIVFLSPKIDKFVIELSGVRVISVPLCSTHYLSTLLVMNMSIVYAMTSYTGAYALCRNGSYQIHLIVSGSLLLSKNLIKQIYFEVIV